MAEGKHSEILNRAHKRALAEQLHIIYPDSVVVTVNGSVMPYARYLSEMNKEKNFQNFGFFPLLTLDYEMLKCASKEDLFNDLVKPWHRASFLSRAKKLVFEPPHEEGYFEGLYDNLIVSFARTMELEKFMASRKRDYTMGNEASTQHNGLLNEYFEASEAYTEQKQDTSLTRRWKDRVADLRTMVGGKNHAPSTRQLKLDADIARVKMSLLRDKNAPIDPIGPLERQRIRATFQRHLESIPVALLEYAVRSHMPIAILPDAHQVIPMNAENARVSFGDYEEHLHIVHLLPDTKQWVLSEEIAHAADLNCGFSDSKRFQEAVKNTPKEAYAGLQFLFDLVYSEQLVQGKSNATLVPVKKSIFRREEYPKAASYEADSPRHIATELLANLVNLDNAPPLSPFQKGVLIMHDMQMTDDHAANMQAIRDAVASAIPELWAVYKGLDGGPSFEQAVKKHNATLPELPVSQGISRA